MTGAQMLHWFWIGVNDLADWLLLDDEETMRSMPEDRNSNVEAFWSLAGLIAAALLFYWIAFGDGFNVIYYDWYLHHAPDTLRIRCEDEQHGVLVGDSCFRKEAVIWPESEAPR